MHNVVVIKNNYTFDSDILIYRMMNDGALFFLSMQRTRQTVSRPCTFRYHQPELSPFAAAYGTLCMGNGLEGARWLPLRLRLPLGPPSPRAISRLV